MAWPVGWTDIDCDCETICRNIGDWRERQDTWFASEPVERVTKKREHRVNRLKAIGNGQVPRCAATAFEMLHRRINET